MDLIKKNIAIVSVWIFFWSFIAIDQLLITFNYLNISNEISTQEAIENINNINKNSLVNTIPQVNERTESKTTKHNYCEDENVWDEINIKIAPDKDRLQIDLPKEINFYKSGITSMYVQAVPQTYNYETYKNAFHMHGLTQIKLNLKEKHHEISLQLLQGLDNNQFYPIGSWDIDLLVKSSHTVCYKSTKLEINNLNYNNIKSLKSFYIEDIIQPVNVINFDVRTIGEEKYLENFFTFQELQALHSELPPPHEAALALLNYTVHPDQEFYTPRPVEKNHRLYGKVVIGLFGDVIKDDLETVNRVLTTLSVVAPGLDISYSDNEEYVNLPIHFANCDDLLSDEAIGCKNFAAGLFYRPYHLQGDYGWIWVDSRYKSDFRQHILVHEIGHALGLNHNLCFDSSMSYAKWAEQPSYFTSVDLMQLRLLYDSRVGSHDSSSRIVNYLELDSVSFKEFKNDKSAACNIYQSGYEDLVQFQKGDLSLEQLLNEGHNLNE